MPVSLFSRLRDWFIAYSFLPSADVAKVTLPMSFGLIAPVGLTFVQCAAVSNVS